MARVDILVHLLREETKRKTQARATALTEIVDAFNDPKATLLLNVPRPRRVVTQAAVTPIKKEK